MFKNMNAYHWAALIFTVLGILGLLAHWVKKWIESKINGFISPLQRQINFLALCVLDEQQRELWKEGILSKQSSYQVTTDEARTWLLAHGGLGVAPQFMTLFKELVVDGIDRSQMEFIDLMFIKLGEEVVRSGAEKRDMSISKWLAWWYTFVNQAKKEGSDTVLDKLGVYSMSSKQD